MVARSWEQGVTPSRPNPVMDAVRQALGRAAGDAVPERPPVLPPRPAGPPEHEIDRLLEEVRALAGVAARIPPTEIDSSLTALVEGEGLERATLWPTPRIAELGLAERLAARGVEVVPASAGKAELARCDLGVTEVDFALPETGTVGLLSSPRSRGACRCCPASTSRSWGVRPSAPISTRCSPRPGATITSS